MLPLLRLTVVMACFATPASATFGGSLQQNQPRGRTIQAGETLRISIVGLLGEGIETRLTRTVDPDGRLRLPRLDTDRLDAVGMTASELENAIARLYGRQQMASAPLVVVSRLGLGEDHALDASRQPMPRPAGRLGISFRGELEPWPEGLAEPIGAPVELSAVPLAKAIDTVAELLNLPVWVDWQGLEVEGVDRDTPAALKLPPTTPARQVLDLLLQGACGVADVQYEWLGGVLLIGSKEGLSKHSRTIAIDVGPLLPPRAAEVNPDLELELIEDLIGLITEVVEPDAWVDNGGTIGRIQMTNERLVVTGTPRMLRDVLNLLEKLAA